MAEARRPLRVWLLSSSLLLGSQIAAAARARSLEFRRIEAGQIGEIPADGGVLLLDLDVGREGLREAILRARGSDPEAWYLCVVGSHVDAEGLRAAKAAGADHVLSRSRLAASLPSILETVFPGPAGESS